MTASGTRTASRLPWYSEEAGFFGRRFLEEYAPWMTPEETASQVSFLTTVLRDTPAPAVLDLACGNGRHASRLSDNGFEVTGLDLNRFLLRAARENATGSTGTPRWIRADMRRLPFVDTFDAVVSFFTSFGFFEREQDDIQVVREVARSLRGRGLFIVDLMNRDFVVSRYRENEQSGCTDGGVRSHRRRFDPVTNRFRHERTRIDRDGSVERWETSVRLYALPELARMLAHSGFAVTGVYGGYRFERFERDRPRMILIAEKRR